jgi:hypothetical protein
MTKFRTVASTFLALAFLVAGAMAAESLKSGPQVGDDVPGPFHPLNVTGPNAGEKFCLYCKNGSNPVAMVFARDVSDSLTKLITKIDAATAEHKDAKLGSFVVFLNDTEDLPNKLKDVAAKAEIKNTILSIDNAGGPPEYKVAKDADVTVVLYNKRQVKANYAFPKGELKGEDIDKIVADISKILPKD